MKVAIIGFGEAGPLFGKTLHAAGASITCFDIKQNQSEQADLLVNKSQALNIRPAASHADAIKDCALVISTVTASQATKAASQCAAALRPGQCWLDLNSVAPDTKRAISNIINNTGAHMIEAVAMDTVPVKGSAVPILMCGTLAGKWSAILNEHGLNTRAISDEYGAASTVKMLRSVIIKGMESLFAESMEAAAQVNATDEVIGSLQATYPSLDWDSVAGYQLSRSCIHAARRAAEMREVAGMLRSMGLTATMACATAAKQQELADRNLASDYTGESIDDFVTALSGASTHTLDQ